MSPQPPLTLEGLAGLLSGNVAILAVLDGSGGYVRSNRHHKGLVLQDFHHQFLEGGPNRGPLCMDRQIVHREKSDRLMARSATCADCTERTHNRDFISISKL